MVRSISLLRGARCGAAIALTLAGATGAGAAPVDLPTFYRHASDCVAVLKLRADTLASPYRGGDAPMKAELTTLTEAGFAFVGTAYKAGLRKAEADRMLADAETELQGRPAAEREQLVSTCALEGRKLLADSNALEQMLVRQKARSRVEKILARAVAAAPR